MYKKILFPTDFSVPSQAAYQFAVELASATKGEILVVYLLKLPLHPETTFGIQPPPFDGKMLEEQAKTAIRLFNEMVDKFPSEVNVDFIVEQAETVTGILACVKKYDIDLVVMSTHGDTHADEFFVGSTTAEVARSSDIPVLAIPYKISLNSIQEIVLPNTMHLDQDEFMRSVKKFQKLFNAKLQVLLINTAQNFYSDAEAKELLERFAQKYELHNYTLNCHNDAQVVNGIISFTGKGKGRIIIMATHGRKGLKRLFKGSIAELVMTKVNQPVCICNLNQSAGKGSAKKSTQGSRKNRN